MLTPVTGAWSSSVALYGSPTAAFYDDMHTNVTGHLGEDDVGLVIALLANSDQACVLAPDGWGWVWHEHVQALDP